VACFEAVCVWKGHRKLLKTFVRTVSSPAEIHTQYVPDIKQTDMLHTTELLVCMFYCKSWDSVVGIVTGYMLDDGGVGV
jgi:hypothetical protein